MNELKLNAINAADPPYKETCPPLIYHFSLVNLDCTTPSINNANITEKYVII